MRKPSIAAAWFAAALLVAPALALAQGAPGPGTPTPPPGTSAPPAAKSSYASRLEARIKSLHSQLKITASEEPQWDAVAQVMRDNAQAVGSLIAARTKNARSMTAVDDLKSYQAIAEAHAAGIAKLVDAFQTLYAAMPPDQQKIADGVFAKAQHRPAARKAAPKPAPAPKPAQ
jgi:periplasmic protein CpxP/Spy